MKVFHQCLANTVCKIILRERDLKDALNNSRFTIVMRSGHMRRVSPKTFTFWPTVDS